MIRDFFIFFNLFTGILFKTLYKQLKYEEIDSESQQAQKAYDVGSRVPNDLKNYSTECPRVATFTGVARLSSTVTIRLRKARVFTYQNGN